MQAHPTHGPIMVKIEMKNGFYATLGMNPTEFDTYVKAHLGSTLYTPADLLTKPDGSLYPNLDAAAQAGNWATYGSLAGKVIVEIIPGTFEQAIEPPTTWVDVVYAQHLMDLYNSGAIANAAVFPSVLGAQTGDPRTRYSDTTLRPWFVVFDGDAATWVNDGNTEWYNANHYLAVVTDADNVSPALSDTAPALADAQARVAAARRGRRLLRLHRLEHRPRQRRAERGAATWLNRRAGPRRRCSSWPPRGVLALLAPAAPAATAATLVTDPTALVNPLVGTGGNGDYSAGNTFPGRRPAARHDPVGSRHDLAPVRRGLQLRGLRRHRLQPDARLRHRLRRRRRRPDPPGHRCGRQLLPARHGVVLPWQRDRIPGLLRRLAGQRNQRRADHQHARRHRRGSPSRPRRRPILAAQAERPSHDPTPPPR